MSEAHEEKSFDLIKEFRTGVSVGWDYIAHTVFEKLPPKHHDVELMGYAGVLFGLAAKLAPKTIVEIGCQYGISTRMWLAVAERTQGQVHSFDIDPECAKLDLGDASRWTFHLGRSQEIAPIACDLLYVDGDHSYEAVCADMMRHGPMVRNGGLVILDDYHRSWPGKIRWIDERFDVLEPIAIGPTAVFRMTPAKRSACSKVFP